MKSIGVLLKAPTEAQRTATQRTKTTPTIYQRETPPTIGQHKTSAPHTNQAARHRKQTRKTQTHKSTGKIPTDFPPWQLHHRLLRSPSQRKNDNNTAKTSSETQSFSSYVRLSLSQAQTISSEPFLPRTQLPTELFDEPSTNKQSSTAHGIQPTNTKMSSALAYDSSRYVRVSKSHDECSMVPHMPKPIHR